MLDVPYSDTPFTWTNKRIPPHTIFDCFDRGYMSNDWLMNFPSSHITRFPITCSDHGAIMFSNLSHVITNRQPYHWENWCLGLKEIKDLLQQI